MRTLYKQSVLYFYATVKCNRTRQAATLKLNIAELSLTTAIANLQGKTQG